MEFVKIGKNEWCTEDARFTRDRNGEISLMDSFYYNNKSTENIDSGISRGIHRFVKIWKQNGEVFEFKK